LDRAVGAYILRALVNRVTGIPDGFTKVGFKLLIGIDNAKLTVLYRYAAGQQIENLSEIQLKCSGCCGGIIFWQL
jgi:hypothetical protein